MFNRVVYADALYVNNYVNNENLVEILSNLVRINDDMVIPTPVTFKAPVSITKKNLLENRTFKKVVVLHIML